MKSLASARTTQTITPAGQLLLTIEHDAVRGVSPAMLRWWFENLGKEMTFNGQTYPRYLLWHPRDHIHWELAQRSPDGGSGKGAHFRIVEAFAANPAYYVTPPSAWRNLTRRESHWSGASPALRSFA